MKNYIKKKLATFFIFLAYKIYPKLIQEICMYLAQREREHKKDQYENE
jgi:hypothetical protein